VESDVRIQNYRELEVWKLAMELAESVYQLTDTLPEHELYGLSSQMRRCAISIPSNIAEGSARSGTKELIHFIFVARGSNAELETQLIFSHRRKYISDTALNECLSLCDRINRMLARLVQSLEKKVA
jgi:four helix bundle protein